SADGGDRQLAAAALFLGLRAGRSLGRGRGCNAATRRHAACRTAIVIILVTRPAAASGNRLGRSGGLCTAFDRAGSGGLFGRSRSFNGRRSRFGSTACSFGGFLGLATFFLGLAAGFVFDALLGFDHFTSLRFLQRAATCLHLACRQ